MNEREHKPPALSIVPRARSAASLPPPAGWSLENYPNPRAHQSQLGLISTVGLLLFVFTLGMAMGSQLGRFPWVPWTAPDSTFDAGEGSGPRRL
jgi:hypothetical protein